MAPAGNRRNDQEAYGVWEPPPPTGSAWPGRSPAGANPSSRPSQPSGAPGGPSRPATGPYAHAASASDRRPPVAGAPKAAGSGKGSVSTDEFEDLCRTIGRSVAQVSEAVSQAISASVAGGAKTAKRKGEAKAAGRAARPAPPSGPAVPASPFQSFMAQTSQKAELKRRDAIVNSRFKKAGSLQASGAAMTTVGACTSVMSAGVLSAVLLTSEAAPSAAATVTASIFMGAFLAASIGLLVGGIRNLRAAGALQSFRRIFGTREACSVAELSAQLHQSPAKTLAQARRLLKKGLLLQGHIDDEGTTVMVTDDAYRHYRQLQTSRHAGIGQATITEVTTVSGGSDAQAAQTSQASKAADAKGASSPAAASPADENVPPQARAFVTQGRSYIARLRELDDDIADAAVSAKIASLVTVVEKIVDRAIAQPAVIADLGRLMDYYLPTTVKLLESYDSLEEQPVQGNNIASSRREIEATLDVLQSAFEKLLDATFQDLSFDVSSDISVLTTVLAQEGLTESPFEKGGAGPTPTR